MIKIGRKEKSTYGHEGARDQRDHERRPEFLLRPVLEHRAVKCPLGQTRRTRRKGADDANDDDEKKKKRKEVKEEKKMMWATGKTNNRLRLFDINLALCGGITTTKARC